MAIMWKQIDNGGMTKEQEMEIREEISNGGIPYLNLNVPVNARIPVDIAETIIRNTYKNINALMEKSLSSERYSQEYLNGDYYSILSAYDVTRFKKFLWFKHRTFYFGVLLQEAKQENRKYVTIKENENDVNEIFKSFKTLNRIDSKIFNGCVLDGVTIKENNKVVTEFFKPISYFI